MRRPRKGVAPRNDEGAGKSSVAPSSRRPTTGARAVSPVGGDINPAPAGDLAKAPVKRVRKTAAKPEEGKE
jgi:hypothetical protein